MRRVMNPISPEAPARARRIEAIILQRLAALGLEAVGGAVGVDSSTVSRWKSREIPQLALAIAAMGLKVVPVELRCYPEEEIEAIFTLAKRRMVHMRHSRELADDDE